MNPKSKIQNLKSAPFLQLIDIHKRYEGAPLLRGVSFDVARGDIACLLGASGSGKTTLLRIIAGLEATDAGRVMLEGSDITNVPPHRRGVVLMFQEYALFPHRTVAQNVAFGLRMRKWERVKTDARVAEMLALVGLAGFDNRDVNELSGGERQRVALARSLAPQPRLLLLDEPLGALDRNLRERLLEELPTILRNVGVTGITVTHDQEEAFALSDHVVLLNEGGVVQSGRPEVLYDHPQNAWVARFLGLDNVFQAQVLDAQRVSVPFGVLVLEDGVALPEPGTKGEILVHPWGVHLGSGSVNAFDARLTRRTFHGSYFRLTLDVTGGTLHISRDAGKLLPDVGEDVRGWLDPTAIRWLLFSCV